ncbi:hypothetical protein D3C76_844030 [compost metagenome]
MNGMMPGSREQSGFPVLKALQHLNHLLPLPGLFRQIPNGVLNNGRIRCAIQLGPRRVQQPAAVSACLRSPVGSQ